MLFNMLGTIKYKKPESVPPVQRAVQILALFFNYAKALKGETLLRIYASALGFIPIHKTVTTLL